MGSLKSFFSRIRVRLLLSFFSAGAVTLLLVIVGTSQLDGILNIEKEIIKVHLPARVHTKSLLGGVHESMYLVSTTFKKDPILRRVSWEECWDKKVLPPLDSLHRLSRQWNNAKAVDLFKQLDNAVHELRPTQNDCLVYLKQANNFDKELGENYFLARERTINFHNNIINLAFLLNQEQISMIEADEFLINEKTSEFKNTEVVLLILAIVLGVLVAWWISNRIMFQINQVKDKLNTLSKGNLPKEFPIFHNELSDFVQSIRRLTSNLANVKEFAHRVGQREFNHDIEVFGNEGELAQALQEMRDSLRGVSEEEAKRQWIAKGLSSFAELLRTQTEDLKLFSEEVIANLVKYVKCNQGGLFMLNKNSEGEDSLELLAFYGYDRKKYLKRVLDIDEGLTGQAIREKNTIHLNDLPPNYINITSGLGEASPSTLLIVPLKSNDKVHGLIELGGFSPFSPHKIEFVERLSENVASAISSVKNTIRTKDLLEESQQQAEQMRAQEEEMRQNMEELQATQEEMRRKQRTLESNENKSKIFFESALHPIAYLNGEGKIIDINPIAEKTFGCDRMTAKEKHISAFLDIEILQGVDTTTSQRAFVRTSAQEKPTFLEVQLRRVVINEGEINIAYMRDISLQVQQDNEMQAVIQELKRAKEEAEQLRKEEQEKAAIQLQEQQEMADELKKLLEEKTVGVPAYLEEAIKQTQDALENIKVD